MFSPFAIAQWLRNSRQIAFDLDNWKTILIELLTFVSIGEAGGTPHHPKAICSILQKGVVSGGSNLLPLFELKESNYLKLF